MEKKQHNMIIMNLWEKCSKLIKLRDEISNNIVWDTSNQPVHMHSLIRAFAFTYLLIVALKTFSRIREATPEVFYD